MKLRPLALFLLIASVARAGVEVDIDKFGESLGGWTKEKKKAAEYKFSEVDFRTYKPEVTTAPDGGVFISVRVDHLRGMFSSDDHASIEMSFAPDGTLLSSGGAGMRALRTPLRELHGVNATLEDIDYAGRTDRHILRQIFTRYHLPISEENFTRFLDGYVATLPVELANPGAYILPGVTTLLKAAATRSDVTQALLTGNVQRGARAKLGYHGLWDFFPFGAFADDSEFRNDLGPHALRRAHAHAHRSAHEGEILHADDGALAVNLAAGRDERILFT